MADGDVDAVRYSQSIQDIAAEMTRLVGDLLDAASIDAGKLAIVAATHEAGRLVHKAVDVFGPAAFGGRDLVDGGSARRRSERGVRTIAHGQSYVPAEVEALVAQQRARLDARDGSTHFDLLSVREKEVFGMLVRGESRSGLLDD